uniref:RNA-binding protein 28 n=2 Tax=Lygus hesperus TaxID=30085 RepID=A0A146LGV9_LYGHE
MKVGLVLPNTKKAEGVSKEDMNKRLLSYKERKKKLMDPNYKLSKYRLHIRNIPKPVKEKELKILVLDAVARAAKSSTLPTPPTKPRIKQLKILYKKSDSKSNEPVSTGCGFIEFDTHESALLALQYLNNNPTVWTKNRRPIVEFALENARKIHERQQRLQKSYEQQDQLKTLRKQAERDAIVKLRSLDKTTAASTPPDIRKKVVKKRSRPSQQESSADVIALQQHRASKRQRCSR